MAKIAVWVSKALMAVALAALSFGSFVPAAYALAPADPVTPPAPTGERLERAWARQQRIYERLGKLFDNADQRSARAQELIDRAKANGKDVTALQAALDAFSAAIKQARPVYEGGKGIISSHQGFDADGKVTDLGKALDTVLTMRQKLMDIRAIIVPPAKALRQAIRDFRQANRPAVTPTPGA